MGKSKVIFGNEVLIDLTADTVEEDKVLSGYTFHGADGDIYAGSCDFDVDSSEATATQSEVLSGKTFAKAGTVLTGTMPNIGAQNGNISAKAQRIMISQGYHDGSGGVGIDATEQAKIIAENIKSGVEILGIEGSYSGETASATTATATPSRSQQVIIPPQGYDYLSQVTVSAIPYTETLNAAGGITVTIG